MSRKSDNEVKYDEKYFRKMLRNLGCGPSIKFEGECFGILAFCLYGKADAGCCLGFPQVAICDPLYPKYVQIHYSIDALSEASEKKQWYKEHQKALSDTKKLAQLEAKRVRDYCSD